MARLFTTGFELGSATAGMEFETNTGTAAVQSTTVRTGTYALQCNPSAATRYMQHTFRADAVADVYIRFYLRIATTPSAKTTICGYGDSANFYGANLRLGTDRKLYIDNSTLGSETAGTTVLATGTWYCIEMFYNETADTATVRIDYVTEINAAAVDDIGGGGRIRLGVITSTTGDLLFDDVAINDTSGSAQTSYPGEGKIIHLHPSAAGDNTQWTPSAGANYTTVGEVTPNNDTDYVRNSTTLNQADGYNIDNSGLTTETINLVHVGFRGRGETATTNQYQFTVRAKKAAAGTISESSNINLAVTSYTTNAGASPKAYPLTLYNDPDGSPWTATTLDSAQIGLKTAVTSTNRVRVSAIWMLVEYQDALISDLTVSKSESVTVTEAGQREVNSFVSKSESITVTESLQRRTDLNIVVGGGTATFGQTGNSGSTSASSASANLANKAADAESTPASDGKLLNVTARVWIDSGTTVAKGVLYDASGALLAVGDEITVSNTTEDAVVFPFSGAQQIDLLAGTKYAYGIMWQDPGVVSINWSRQGTATAAWKNNLTYPTPDDPLGAGAVAGPIDMFVTYSSGETITVSDAASATITEDILDYAINVNESITVTESVQRLVELYVVKSENITVSESVSRMVESYATKSDTVTLTENVKVERNSDIVKSENITVSEAKQLQVDLFITKSESVTVSESQNIAVIADRTLTDTVSLTESTQVTITTEVSKSDSITITESLQRMVESYIAKSESITVTENIAVFVEVPDLAVAVADSITLFEGVTDMYNGFGAGYFGFPYFGGIDQITTIAVEVATAVTKTETVTITENLSVEHIDGSSPLTASESTTVSEAITVHLESYINNSETAIITESTALFVYPLITNSTENASISESVHVAITTDGILSDIVSVSESVGLSVSTQLSTSDTVIITELVQLSVESYVTKTDTVSVSEDTRHEVVSYIDNAETVTVGESLNTIVPDNSIIVGVSESITVSEAISSLIDPLFISKTETVAVTESNNIAITTAGILSEVISVNESVQLYIPVDASKTETITVTDTPSVRLESYINKSENVIATESQLVETDAFNIVNSDTATITELIGQHVTSYVNKSESVTVSENRSVAPEMPDLSINESDTITITESVAFKVYTPIQAPSEAIMMPIADNTVALTQNSESIELTIANDNTITLM